MASIWLRWTAASTTPQRTTLVDLSRCRVLWSCGVRQNPEKGYRTRNVYFLSSGETVWIDPKYTRLIRSHRIDLNHSRHHVFDLYWTTESTSYLQFIIMLFVHLANEFCRKNAETIKFWNELPNSYLYNTLQNYDFLARALVTFCPFWRFGIRSSVYRHFFP